jgi:hypothetical protein
MIDGLDETRGLSQAATFKPAALPNTEEAATSVSHRDWAPLCGLAAVVALFVSACLAVAIPKPAWEAFDEPGHVLNVETLVRGRWYRIERDAGLEPHQPPLLQPGKAGGGHNSSAVCQGCFFLQSCPQHCFCSAW